MPHRVEKIEDDHFAVIYFFKWDENAAVVAVSRSKTQAESEARRDKKNEFEVLVSDKLDVAFTDLRFLLEKKGIDNGIDNETILNWVDTWLYEKRMYLIEVN
jgi:hypothetical protein